MVTMPLSLSLSHSLARPYNRKPFQYSLNNNNSFSTIFPHSRPSRLRNITASSSSSPDKLAVQRFASISSSTGKQTSSVGVGVTPPSVPPPPSQIGSPLFWIGVGVGLSALFSWVAATLKKYAMQQAFKNLMGQMDTQNNQFSNAVFSPGPGTPFPFPSASSPRPASSPPPASTQPSVTVDVAATRVEAAPATRTNDEPELKKEPKKIAFVDVSPEETKQESPFESSLKDVADKSSPRDRQVVEEVSQNGTTPNLGFGAPKESQSTTGKGSTISVEALEKMMEDPTVQKMVYP
ncbi:Protein TIC [Parasponia andersonii]|uniref:Protein TIC n=1 Tax=Parasponia andersonii TaxID=3476 RepID=A0A2P5AL99_PARAD|nr:Protein TIC [Parasponia andersonii]